MVKYSEDQTAEISLRTNKPTLNQTDQNDSNISVKNRCYS
jgi:hypothetical protein